MKILCGILVIMVGLAIAGYLGIYLMLYGGIMQIIAGVSPTPVVASDIAIGILKILFCETAVIPSLPFLIGGVILMKEPARKTKRTARFSRLR